VMCFSRVRAHELHKAVLGTNKDIARDLNTSLRLVLLTLRAIP
jgi:hypothetical protein